MAVALAITPVLVAVQYRCKDYKGGASILIMAPALFDTAHGKDRTPGKGSVKEGSARA